MFNGLFGWLSSDIGIDLGTANTLVYVKDQGIVLREPSVVAVQAGTNKEIGVGLPVQDPAGNMIIDIGGGTTEVVLISLSGIVFSRSVRVAGDELDEAIVQYMKRAYNLMIGERTAEEIKIKIGSAYPSEKETSVEVKGRDLVAGLPKTLMITSQEVREALLEPISTIVDSVRITLERCPPELSADLVDRGLVLAGGGALLRGFDKLLSEETGLPVHVAEDPLSAVAAGTGKCLNELKFLRQVASSDRNWRSVIADCRFQISDCEKTC